MKGAQSIITEKEIYYNFYYTYNILFQSVSYSIMVYVIWLFLFLFWKKLTQEHQKFQCKELDPAY